MVPRQISVIRLREKRGTSLIAVFHAIPQRRVCGAGGGRSGVISF